MGEGEGRPQGELNCIKKKTIKKNMMQSVLCRVTHYNNPPPFTMRMPNPREVLIGCKARIISISDSQSSPHCTTRMLQFGVIKRGRINQAEK